MDSAIGFQQELLFSIYTMKYYTNNHRIHFLDSLLERVFWVATVVAGFACAALLIYEAFVDWINYPSGNLKD